jgi:para-aminobenzoate synthetase component 2
MVLVIDNYDSFTYNLVQYLGELGAEQTIVRNDAVTVPDIQRMGLSHIVISPGPCTTRQAGISVDVVRALHRSVPILGVCLGHQAIGDAFGGKVIKAPSIVHGKTSPIHHSRTPLYRNVPDPFKATRYHSLIVDRTSFPDELEIDAWTDDGIIMGMRHKHWPTFGVQFHPESIATEHGKDLLRNFLSVK